jgi:hypothetical protein
VASITIVDFVVISLAGGMNVAAENPDIDPFEVGN